VQGADGIPVGLAWILYLSGVNQEPNLLMIIRIGFPMAHPLRVPCRRPTPESRGSQLRPLPRSSPAGSVLVVLLTSELLLTLFSRWRWLWVWTDRLLPLLFPLAVFYPIHSGSPNKALASSYRSMSRRRGTGYRSHISSCTSDRLPVEKPRSKISRFITPGPIASTNS